jgi:hypothetical protein
MSRSFNCTTGDCGAIDCETCRGKGAAADYWAAELAREEAAALDFHDREMQANSLGFAMREIKGQT